jgi:hypothetical protein
MAIFAIRSATNVHEHSPNNPSDDTTNGIQPPSTTTTRPTEAVPEEMMRFDDDMAHFVTHLEADPLAESRLKMRLVEYHSHDDGSIVREITDDEDEYTYFHRPLNRANMYPDSSPFKSCRMQR